jgi:hypothetical protein
VRYLRFKDATYLCLSAQTGVLSLILPLLRDPACMHLALQSLASMTHSGGLAKVEVVRAIPQIIAVLEAHPEDAGAAELVAMTVAHSCAVVVGDHGDASELNKLALGSILDTLVAAARRENATPDLVEHVLDLITFVAAPASAAVRNSTALDFAIAFLRSEDIGARCSALRTLFRLALKDAEEDRTQIDPQKFVELARRRLPDEVGGHPRPLSIAHC